MSTAPGALAAEIRRLAASGLTAPDISVALRIDLGAVLEALEPKTYHEIQTGGPGPAPPPAPPRRTVY